jgi:hypothetical protein
MTVLLELPEKPGKVNLVEKRNIIKDEEKSTATIGF